MSVHDAWVSLRHGGNLLSPLALGSLPSPLDPPWGLADRLRTALVSFDPDKPTSSSLGALLDVVLEDVCGLRVGWEKGSALGASDGEKLLDGTALKPRRRWTGPGGEIVVAFTTSASRIGVGKGRRPVAQVVEYLRRRTVPFGILSNGSQWRLIWADTDSLAWVQWEADRWLDADQLSDELGVLRRVLAPSSLYRGKNELSPLQEAIRDTRRGQAKLSKELGERVRRAVETLLKSRRPLVGPVWDDHDSSELYVAACHFIMRLVVTLFAESRELLPTDNPVYHQGYGLRGLLGQLDPLTPERRRSRRMAWPRLLALFRLLHQGSPHPAMALPAYGGDLFCPGSVDGDGVQRALALLEAIAEPPDDDVVHRVLVLLTRTTQKVREGAGWRTVAAPVDFTELTSEYIGILYEGLLDYELHRAGDEPVVFLNLGDQPALPLDRLEAMDDPALKALVEKARVKKAAASDDDDDDDTEDEDKEDDQADDTADDEPVEEAGSAHDDDTPDDARAAARGRALAWGRKAAEVGKLVKKPRGRKADIEALYAAQLDTAAEQLVADLKLPGELYLVRWGGTRKGAGTFYTRPQLTLPTVRRTLEPLLVDDDGEPRTPEELLALKVCDPAMGSGSFLVAALRVLTAAVTTSLHFHGRVQRVNGRTTVDCALLPEADRSLPSDGLEERLEAIVRRAVVEHCLYGVDLDPLAVELGRVALWVETLDKRLPFTFLDHKLRCGDSLVGTWLDRFRDYPLLAFDRQSPDQKYKGVNHRADTWHKALKAKRGDAIQQQVELLTGQLRLVGQATSDEELKVAVERVRRLYRELRAVPAGRPDERARIWRERIQTDAAMRKVREAFDTWCSIWFWPLDKLDALPLPSELAAPSDAARAVVKELRDQRRFLHWELEFPDVFTEEGAGFDVVVGNPPWEIQKPNSKEFFSNHDPLYRSYGKQEGLRVQKTLFEAHPGIEEQWLAYNGDFKNRGNFVKHAAEPFGDGKVANHGGGDVSLVRGKQGAGLHRTWRGRRARYRGTSDPAHPFQHQGSADLNTYKMFVEVGHALLRRGGQLGLVVPSGLYTDKGTGDLRRLLLRECAWRWLYGFENRNKLFDIHRSFKFCVVIAAKGGTTEAVRSAFMRRELEDWVEEKAVLDYPAERVASFSPKSLSFMEFRAPRGLAIFSSIADSGVPIRDISNVEYIHAEFFATADSQKFIHLDEAKKRAFASTDLGWWTDGRTWLVPVVEGRMVGVLQGNQKAWVSGKGRGAVWDRQPVGALELRPQYLVPLETYRAQRAVREGWKLTLMDVTSATNRRTMTATVEARTASVDSCRHLVPRDGGLASALRWAGSFGSFVFDYMARFRIGGLHVTWFQLADMTLPRDRASEAELLAARLSLVEPRFDHGWHELSQVTPRLKKRPKEAWLAITSHERIRVQSMLDAIVGALYGLDRTDFAWIIRDCDYSKPNLSDRAFCRRLDPKGFWRIDKSEEPELRHTVLSLAAFDDLQTCITAAGGDRDAGIQAFCAQNDGDGWMLPETLCLADLGLTRTVDVGVYDDRARTPQPVRSRMGARFLDWQLAQTPEESWAECERHAKAILEGMPAPPRGPAASSAAAPRQQLSLLPAETE